MTAGTAGTADLPRNGRLRNPRPNDEPLRVLVLTAFDFVV
jgi:hypothetical protein